MCCKNSKNIRESFDGFDKDKNGQIDLTEFRALLKAIGSDMGPKDAETAFDTIDTDENGLVNFEEFSLWWDTSCLDEE